MFLDPFHSTQQNSIIVTPEQASRFAKEVANDFNPLHDAEAKRFCVPGDLLFSLVLARYGLSQQMRFTFSGMVGKGAELLFPECEPDTQSLVISDNKGKTYLDIERHGAHKHDLAQIEPLVLNYVAFSGQNFPHVLVPLMAEQNVMINPERPLVIYESMSLTLDHLDFTQPTLRQSGSELDCKGKRANVTLNFDVIDQGGEVVGEGAKRLVVSGIREYSAELADEMSKSYMARQKAYLSQK